MAFRKHEFQLVKSAIGSGRNGSDIRLIAFSSSLGSLQPPPPAASYSPRLAPLFRERNNRDPEKFRLIQEARRRSFGYGWPPARPHEPASRAFPKKARPRARAPAFNVAYLRCDVSACGFAPCRKLDHSPDESRRLFHRENPANRRHSRRGAGRDEARGARIDKQLAQQRGGAPPGRWRKPSGHGSEIMNSAGT